jgi:hypothetical protein
MSISLQSALRTCTVDHNNTARYQSSRWLEPSQNVCPVWNGKDNLGREVHRNSFYNKAAGCNHPSERVDVEIFHRPKYFQYTTLDAGGLEGDGSYGYAQPHNTHVQSINSGVGSFGQDFGKQVHTSCSGRGVRNQDNRYAHASAVHNNAAARGCQSGN